MNLNSKNTATDKNLLAAKFSHSYLLNKHTLFTNKVVKPNGSIALLQ